jgi:hypothetical protein
MAEHARRKTMMAPISEPEPPMRDPEGGIRDWFKLRVAYQQFLRENEALFRALAEGADAPYRLRQEGGLDAATAAATARATAAATVLSGNPSPSVKEIQPFRAAAAMMVASAWRSGKLSELDPAGIGAQIAAAAHIVDEDLDRSIFKTSSISDEASLRMTSMSVTLRLFEPVLTYDFRRDQSELVAGMAAAVMATAAEATGDVVLEGGKADDRRSVLQTAANCLATIMAQVYDRKARQFVGHVKAMPETERESFIRRYDPMPEILRAFREHARVYCGAAYASATLAADAAAGIRSGDTRPR